MPLSKNHNARLRKVTQQLDKALDSLMQANGQLWPNELRPYGTLVQEAVATLQGVHAQIQNRLADNEVVPDAVEVANDPDQEDVEDIEGVEQPQPSRRRRA